MRILYVVPWLFGKPRNTASEYHVELINALADRNNELSVVCFSPEPDKLKYILYESVKIHAIKASISQPTTIPIIFSSLLKNIPLVVAKYDSDRIREEIHKIIMSQECPDAALLEYIEVAPYATQIRNAKLTILLQLIDIEAQKYRLLAETSHSALLRFGAWVEAKRMLRFELETVRNNKTVCLSGADRDLVRQYLPEHEIDVIPLAINIKKYKFNPSQENNGKIVFIGPADYYKNAIGIKWFLKNVFSHVLESWPEAKFRVVNVQQNSVMARLITSYPRTEIVDFVDDIHDEIRKALVLIAPMKVASGVSGRVISTLALGSPLVATSLACQGLGVKSGGEHLWIADDPKEFAAGIVSFAKMETGDKSAMLARGRKYVECNHDIRTVAQMIEEKFLDYMNVIDTLQ